MFEKINNYQYWDQGWKLVEGCDPVSEGCKNCWSLGMEKWLGKDTNVKFHHERLIKPYKFKKPTSFCVWNDLFHDSVHFLNTDRAFEVMTDCKQHIFMVLTKRIKRAVDWVNHYNSKIPDNIWMGVTVETQDYDWRITELLKIPAKIRFVSIEPFLGHMDGGVYDSNGIFLYNWLEKIDWVIAGRETGRGARPMKIEWLQSIHQQCKYHNVPFFDKRNELSLNIQQFPK